jgi:predicted Zn-dependent protease
LEKQGLWAQSCEILNYIVTELDRTDAHSYLAWGKLQSRRERGGLLRKGGSNQIDLLQNEEPLDVKTFNGILQSSAKEIFEMGTSNCPKSIHLWHGWAMHEQSLGNIDKARELLDKALEIDSGNGYVCHSYGLLEMQCGDTKVG